MTTSMLVLPIPGPAAGSLKRKRVLLVDASPAKRDLRAEALKKLGIDVDCACDITEARSWWRADLYNLVLMNMENELGNRDRFCEDVRGATPPQQLAFLVGKPEYLAHSPNAESLNADGLESAGTNGNHELRGDTGVSMSVDASGGSTLPWGILEASRRISVVRSVSAARTKEMRNRPTPPRDLEARFIKHLEAETQILSEVPKEVQKEEMQ
jgi:CheY-like chemotaxis protein